MSTDPKVRNFQIAGINTIEDGKTVVLHEGDPRMKLQFQDEKTMMAVEEGAGPYYQDVRVNRRLTNFGQEDIPKMSSDTGRNSKNRYHESNDSSVRLSEKVGRGQPHKSEWKRSKNGKI